MITTKMASQGVVTNMVIDLSGRGKVPFNITIDVIQYFKSVFRAFPLWYSFSIHPLPFNLTGRWRPSGEAYDMIRKWAHRSSPLGAPPKNS